jgi:hypothetical protein
VKVEEFIKNGNDFVVTETQLRANMPADEIVDAVRERRATGELRFYFIDGGVRSVMLIERKKPSTEERGKIRAIFQKL